MAAWIYEISLLVLKNISLVHCAHSKRNFISPRGHVISSMPDSLESLRRVPTIVIAHTFCASRDTRISYRWCLLIQGYFCAVLNYPEKVDLSKCPWYPKRKLGVTMHFWEIIQLQFEKERHTLLCILKLFTNIIHQLYLKNAWLPPIFFLDFNNTC